MPKTSVEPVAEAAATTRSPPSPSPACETAAI